MVNVYEAAKDYFIIFYLFFSGGRQVRMVHHDVYFQLLDKVIYVWLLVEGW